MSAVKSNVALPNRSETLREDVQRNCYTERPETAQNIHQPHLIETGVAKMVTQIKPPRNEEGNNILNHFIF